MKQDGLSSGRRLKEWEKWNVLKSNRYINQPNRCINFSSVTFFIYNEIFSLILGGSQHIFVFCRSRSFNSMSVVLLRLPHVQMHFSLSCTCPIKAQQPRQVLGQNRPPIWKRKKILKINIQNNLLLRGLIFFLIRSFTPTFYTF